jgi:hypothetical protein
MNKFPVIRYAWAHNIMLMLIHLELLSFFFQKFHEDIKMFISIFNFNIWNTYWKQAHCRPIRLKFTYSNSLVQGNIIISKERQFLPLGNTYDVGQFKIKGIPLAVSDMTGIDFFLDFCIISCRFGSKTCVQNSNHLFSPLLQMNYFNCVRWHKHKKRVKNFLNSNRDKIELHTYKAMFNLIFLIFFDYLLHIAF